MRLQASNQAGASRGPTERGSDRCAEAAELRARLDRAGPELLADAEALQLLLAPVGGQAGGLAIRLARDLVRRALEAPLRRRCALTSSSAVHAYLRGVLTGVGREQFRVLFLDRQNGLIADEVMGWGSVDHAPVYPREVVRRALERNASALILAHNHPSGDLSLSHRTLEKHRTYGTGPAYRKIGGRVVYAVEDLQAWAEQGRQLSTSDPGAGSVRPAKRHAALSPAYARR